jgi:hypothetical protein
VAVLKLDTFLNVSWSRNIDLSPDEDMLNDLIVDDNNNIYITGHLSSSGGIVAYLLKLDESGNDVWFMEYFSDNGFASGRRITLDPLMNPVVIGTIQNGSQKNFFTVKYTSDGDPVFADEFDNGGDEYAAGIFSDQTGNIYITGISSSGANNSYVTSKYSTYKMPEDVVYAEDTIPYYMDRQVIVRFSPNAVRKEIIDNVYGGNITFGKIEDFLKPWAVDEFYTVFNHELEYTLTKVFSRFNTWDTISISRLGDTVRIPTFWATFVLVLPPGEDVMEATENVEGLSFIRYALPNWIATLASAPNDPLYNDTLWGAHQFSLHPHPTYPNSHVNVEPAWEIETGKPHVRVGVFDTGLDWQHPDFYGSDSMNIHSSAMVKGWTFSLNQSIKNFTQGDFDPFRHGTKTTGVIGAKRNNGKGIAGIAGGSDHDSARGVSIYSLQITTFWSIVPISTVADAIITSSSDIPHKDPLKDIHYALHLSNNSWIIHDDPRQGDKYKPDTIQILSDALKYAFRNKVTYVASKGNEGHNRPSYPADYNDDWIISVGGTGVSGGYKRIGIYT